MVLKGSRPLGAHPGPNESRPVFSGRRYFCGLQADELCRQCLVWAMRFHLGNDDRAIMEEAQQILESSWGPVLNHRLADVLMESRTHFSML